MLAFPTSLLPSHSPLHPEVSLSLSGSRVSPIFFLCALGRGCPVCGGAWGGQARDMNWHGPLKLLSSLVPQ